MRDLMRKVIEKIVGKRTVETTIADHAMKQAINQTVAGAISTEEFLVEEYLGAVVGVILRSVSGKVHPKEWSDNGRRAEVPYIEIVCAAIKGGITLKQDPRFDEYRAALEQTSSTDFDDTCIKAAEFLHGFRIHVNKKVELPLAFLSWEEAKLYFEPIADVCEYLGVKSLTLDDLKLIHQAHAIVVAQGIRFHPSRQFDVEELSNYIDGTARENQVSDKARDALCHLANAYRLHPEKFVRDIGPAEYTAFCGYYGTIGA